MRTNYFLITLVAISVFFVACDDEFKDGQPGVTAYEARINGTVFEGLLNADDAEDELIDQKLFYLGLTLKEVLKDFEIKGNFSDAERYNEYGEAKLEDLLGDEGIVKFLEEMLLIEGLSMSFGELTAMVYQSVNYYPSITYYNREAVEVPGVILPSEYYGVAIGSAVTEEDQIPVWINDQGDQEIILLSEAEALDFPMPIYIINNGTDEVVIAETTEGSWQETETGIAAASIYEASWTGFRVKKGYRYEKSGKTDLRFAYTMYHPWIPYYDQLFEALDGRAQQLDRQKIRNIKKSEVNSSTYFTNSVILTQQNQGFADLYDMQFYVTVYEYDWYASRKTVQGCVGGVLQHGVEMKYSNEWYYVDYCGFGFAGSWVGANFTVDNAKCTLKIERTQ